MAFSVIAANFQKEDVLERFFSSFISLDPSIIWELIFVDDASTDNSLSIAEQFAEKLPIKIIKLSQNKGPAHARNKGLEHSAFDHVVFCDTDIEFDSKILLNAYSFFTANKLDVFTFNLDLEPLRDKWMGRVYLLEEYENLEAGNVQSGPHRYFSTTLSIVSKKWIMDLNGFDESYSGADIEDLILAFKDSGETSYWFSREHVFSHDYSSNVLVFKKAFSRSFDLARLDNVVLHGNPLLDNRFRVYGYVLTLIWSAFFFGSLLFPYLFKWLIILTFVEVIYHHRFYSLGFTKYGAIFCFTQFFGRLIFVLSAFVGHVLGKVYPKKPV